MKNLLKYLISLVHTDVPNNPKNCAQYFKLLSMFAQACNCVHNISGILGIRQWTVLLIYIPNVDKKNCILLKTTNQNLGKDIQSFWAYEYYKINFGCHCNLLSNVPLLSVKIYKGIISNGRENRVAAHWWSKIVFVKNPLNLHKNLQKLNKILMLI